MNTFVGKPNHSREGNVQTHSCKRGELYPKDTYNADGKSFESAAIRS